MRCNYTNDLKTIKVQVYMHGAPTVIDYNLTLNWIFPLKKFRSGHPAMQEFFNPPSSYLTIQTLVLTYMLLDKHTPTITKSEANSYSPWYTSYLEVFESFRVLYLFVADFRAENSCGLLFVYAPWVPCIQTNL